MNLFQKYLAPMLSRLLGAGLVAVTPWLAVNVGIELDAETRQHLVELAVGLIIYFVSHRLLSIKLNPDDVAKPHPESQPTNPVVVPRVPTGLDEGEGQ